MNKLGKPFRKKNRSRKSKKKNRKNQSETAACEQKTTKRKSEFLFKHCFLTLR